MVFLASLGRALEALAVSWAIGCDGNMDPNSEGLRARRSQLEAAVAPPKVAIFSAGGGSALDYFILPHRPPSCADQIAVMLDALTSPRFPVELWLKCASLLRRLRPGAPGSESALS